VQLVKRPGHPRFVLYVHPPMDAGPNDDPVVLDLDPDTPLWLMRPADATRVGVAPETAATRAAVAGLSSATAAAVAEAAGRGALVLYDFELTYSRKQAEQAVKRASSQGGGSARGGGHHGHAGASSGGAPNPFHSSGGGGGGGALGRLFGCFRKPAADAATPHAAAAPPADPAAAAAADATAAAAVAATGVQPGTPRTPESLARVKEALSHAGVPSHKRVRLAFEDEVLAKTWHSLVALTLGYVAPDAGRTAGKGTQSSLGAYQS
jgi:hypothetical protein